MARGLSVNHFNFLRLAALFFTLVSLGACTGSPTPVSPKPIFDSTIYVNKPATLAKDFPILITNSWFLFQDCILNADGSLASATPTSDGGLSESACRYRPHGAKAQGSKRLVIDLEDPQLTPARCLQILTWIRSEKVGLELGFFSLPTTPDYAPVLKASDFVAPGVYWNGNYASWQKYMFDDVTGTKALAPGKPCYTFVCPRYTYAVVGDHLAWDLLPPEVWAETLAYTLSISTGVIVWDASVDPVTGARLDWSAAASTWYPQLQKPAAAMPAK